MLIDWETKNKWTLLDDVNVFMSLSQKKRKENLIIISGYIFGYEDL